MRDLDYQFGDDGIFWMPYEDFLIRFVEIWRTRLFTADWKVTQKWTTVQVPWAGDYNPTKFQFTLSEPTRAVIVLSKLDASYFVGLAGQYIFDIAFRLHGKGEEPHLIRGYSSGDRSASAELDLEEGEYEVLMQISATRARKRSKIEDVVEQNWLTRRDKLIQIGLSYDLAQAKGQLDPEAEEKAEASPSSQTQDTQAAVTPSTPTAEASMNSTTNFTSEAEEGEEATLQERGGLGAGLSDDPNPPAPAPEPVPNPAPSVVNNNDEGQDSDTVPDSGVWNATLVVGLRVFCEYGSVEIKTITPSSEEDAQKAKEEVLLDVDDPEKDLAEHFSKKVALTEETMDDDM